MEAESWGFRNGMAVARQTLPILILGRCFLVIVLKAYSAYPLQANPPGSVNQKLSLLAVTTENSWSRFFRLRSFRNDGLL